MKKTIKTLLTTIFCLLLIPVTNAQSIKPPIIAVKKGDALSYSFDMQISSTQTMGGNQIESLVTQSMLVNFSVEDITSDNLINMAGKIHDFSMHISGAGMDTTNTFGEESYPFNVVYNEFGEEIKRETDTTKKAFSGQLDMDNPSSTFSPFTELSKKKIDVGDTWTEEKTDTLANKPFDELIIHSITISKYTGIENKDGIEYYVIQVSQEMEISGTGDMQEMQLFAEGEGVNEGEVYIIKDSGVIFSSKSLTEMSMNIAISGQQSMTIPMLQKIESNQQLIIE